MQCGKEKSVGPDELPLEELMILGNLGIRWLTSFLNKMLVKGKLPKE